MSKLSTEIRSYFQSRSAQRKGQGKVLNILQLKHYITEKNVPYSVQIMYYFRQISSQDNTCILWYSLV